MKVSNLSVLDSWSKTCLNSVLMSRLHLAVPKYRCNSNGQWTVPTGTCQCRAGFEPNSDFSSCQGNSIVCMPPNPELSDSNARINDLASLCYAWLWESVFAERNCRTRVGTSSLVLSRCWSLNAGTRQKPPCLVIAFKGLKPILKTLLVARAVTSLCVFKSSVSNPVKCRVLHSTCRAAYLLTCLHANQVGLTRMAQQALFACHAIPC